jgi:hypothetical protein
MQKCISKELLDCLHLTKETRDEFLKEFESHLGEDDRVLIDDNEKEIVVRHAGNIGYFDHYYFYNHWYVRDREDYTFLYYSDDEFNEMFELISVGDEIAIKVFEKEKPKLPIIVTNLMTKEKMIVCPSCNFTYEDSYVGTKCCKECGQRFKWE